MALKDIFKRSKNDAVTPLNMEEKALFVEVFLKTKDIIAKDFGQVDGESRFQLTGTPQYTLVLFLDFFYVFVMNRKFRDSHVEAAAKMDIDLHDFRLNPSSMMKLGEYYTSFRNLSESELEEVRRLWRGQINDSNQGRVYALEEAALYWSESIVRAVQIVDLLESGRSQGILETEEYMQKIELNLSFNKSLVSKYFEMRKSVK